MLHVAWEKSSTSTNYYIFDYTACIVTAYDLSGQVKSSMVSVYHDGEQISGEIIFHGRYSELDAYKVLMRMEDVLKERGGFLPDDYFGEEK